MNETPSAVIGYARVSTGHQDLTPQLDALTKQGIDPERIYSDKLSGRAGSERPGLTAALAYLRPGDVICCTAIDRLGRSVAEVTGTLANLTERGITVRALREGIDTSTPTGRAVAGIMASLAELEADLGRERRAASRAARIERGLPATCPPKLTADQQRRLVRLYQGGEPVAELMKLFGVSRATVFRVLARYKDAA